MTTDVPAAQPAAYVCGPIEVLEGLEPVRRRPGMYLGDVTDGSALHNMAYEVIDNAVDQHAEDRCFRLAVTLHAGGALTVEDDGPGISLEPVVVHGERMSMLEGIFTCCHTFGACVRFHRGMDRLRGVGVAPVNALCERLVVEVRRGGRLHRLSYRRGRPDGPVAVLGAAESTGTRVTLHPDPRIFPSTAFDARRVLDRLRAVAFLHPGLRIDFTDERPGGRRETLHGRGIAAWVALLGEGRDGFPAEPLRLRGARHDVVVDVALRWTRAPGSRVRTFAHHQEVGGAMIETGIAKAIKDVARRTGTIGALRGWDPRRLTRGLTAIADLRGPGLDTHRACCNVLGESSVRVVREVVADRLADELELQPSLLTELVTLAVG